MNRESLKIEFKREYTEEVKKTVIAFANTDGGEIRIGVDDDGTVVGVADVDSVMLQVTNSVRDSIKPDVTMFLLCESREVEGKPIIIVDVQRGTARPYYLAGKGVRPEGVFIRQGASTVPATESAILKMIRETSGDSYETARSLMQELTFRSAERIFREEKIRFGAEQKRTLGLIGEDGSFSNLALLLSDQCLHTVRLAVFEGASKRVFKDRSEFSGSLLQQLEEIYDSLDRINRTRAEFSGLKRTDIRDYPPEALREALLNAIVHRDYSYSASTLVSVFDDRIEFVSLGGLPKGIGYGDMMLGVSVLRNGRLAEIFYRLRLIEAFGTGMPKIMECYRGYEAQPGIELSDNAFKITLPNVNFRSSRTTGEDALPDAETRVLKYMAGRSATSRKEIESALGLSQSSAIRVLNGLVERNLVLKTGRGKNTAYSVAE
jgi:ATP-dependent DNA helicase RecG